MAVVLPVYSLSLTNPLNEQGRELNNMKQYLRFAKRLSLLFTSVVATSVFFTSPSQAATFAYSDGELRFTNFSGVLFTESDSDNNAETEAITLGNNDIVELQNNPVVDIADSPLEIFTSVGSSAFGEGNNYLGLAKTESEIVSNFDIGAGQTFSFGFSSFLNLETEIDVPPAENAQSSGDIAFYLFDTSDISEQALPDFLTDLLDNTININKSPLAFFSLAVRLNTLGDNDFITSQNSQDITITDNFEDFSFGGNQEFATASFQGSFQRYFDNPANVTLIATRRSLVRVAVPEPSTTLALLLLLALLSIATKGRLKATISERSSEVAEIQ